MARLSEPTVSAAYAKALFELAVDKGADRAALAASAQIDETAFSNPYDRLPFAKFKALMQAGQTLANAPALGLYFGSQIAFDHLSIVGLVCRAAPTMAAAFDEMNRYGRLIIEVENPSPNDRFKIAHRDGHVWIDDTRSNPNGFPELTESTLGRFICGIGRFFPDRAFFKSAQVTHEAPEYAALYEEILGVPVMFDCPVNAMQVDETWLNQKINSTRNYVFGPLSAQASALLADLEASKSVRAKVERALMPILHTGDVGMETIAIELGQSKKALYRSLLDEGVGYKTVLDDLRKRLALDYLSTQRVSVNEAAYLVGFSDPSAFSRAFKRWTGKSPVNYSA